MVLGVRHGDLLATDFTAADCSCRLIDIVHGCWFRLSSALALTIFDSRYFVRHGVKIDGSHDLFPVLILLQLIRSNLHLLLLRLQLVLALLLITTIDRIVHLCGLFLRLI